MPAPTLFDAAVDNRSLFSDHFLTERLPQHPAWQEDVSDLFMQAQQLYENERGGLRAANEAQTEERFIKPLLRLLGWHYDVQAEATRHGRRNVPDYALFPSDRARAEAARLRSTSEDAYFARAAAVADAKYWGRPLDATGDAARDRLSNKNPSFQIVNYMTAAHLDWGVLTNGVRWRLYYAEAHSRVDTFYEANLEHLLRHGSEDDFRRFWLFFRADAFRRDPQTGRSFVESVYDGSVQYGKALEGRLKERIFDDVFLHLADGFLADVDADAPAQADLDAVYHGTLRLLYRLLFLLHAEARALLPVDERHGYYQKSLMHIKEGVKKVVVERHTLSRTSNDMWYYLNGLFRRIDKGDPDLNVPHYNGGLFDRHNPKNAFLNEHAVADAYLAPALDKLARDADGHFVDYKALDVEQLGSIYEGLLEFRLRWTAKGGLFLENDKGERKATGSYYTPHYIVEYITRNTLGPVLKEREAAFRRLMDEQILPKRKKLKRLDPHGPSALGLKKQLQPLEHEAAEKLLGLKVCDPAMGSGHFLVEAVAYLTERLITILNDYPENPVLRRLEKIRTRILDELRDAGIAVDAERLGDTNLLKRMVMKRCIYGVDLNPMAVELARLSLWLDSFTVGAPLSFLNHHLKTGNALIGEHVRAVEGQLKTDLFGSAFAGMLLGTELMQAVALNTDATFAEVEESARKYADFEAGMAPYRRMLDLWTSRHFGNPEGAALLRDYGGQVRDALKACLGPRSGGNDSLTEKQQATLKKADAVAQEKHFFHWELAFPEVFFDLDRSNWKTNPGFDAVIGNPPYVRIQTLNETAPADVEYFNEAFESPSGNYDVYSLFIEKGGTLLNTDGSAGYILPHKFFQANYGEGLRRWVSERGVLRRIVDFGSKQVFENATTYTCLFFLEGSPRENFQYVCPSLPTAIAEDGVLDSSVLSHSILDEKPWAFGKPKLLELRARLQEACPVLKEATSRIYQGLKTSADAIYIVDEVGRDDEHLLVHSPHCDETFRVEPDLFHPLIKGGDANAYHLSRPDRRILFPYGPRENGEMDLIPVDDLQAHYPLTWAYLSENKEDLEARESGAFDDENWYRFGRTQALDVISQPKTFTPDFAPSASFAYDEAGDLFFTGGAAGGYGILVDPPHSPWYLLTLLNSSLLDAILSTLSTMFRGDWYSYEARFIKHLPIREIAFSTPEDVRAAAVEEAVAAYEAAVAQQEFLPWTGEVPRSGGGVDAEDANPRSTTPESPPVQLVPTCREEGSFSSVLTLVDAHLAAAPERADVVHDLLSHLARAMTALHEECRHLDAALDPFKFLDRSAAFRPFPEVFSRAIKYGERLTDPADLSAVHHDLDGLRLVPDGERGRLDVRLKMRDPESGWRGWQKDGHEIVRAWAPAYRFDLPDERARYYQHAFRVLDRFAHAGSFPGGYTRSTEEKLRATCVPGFDPAADLTPLVELSEERAAVEQKIARTDALIDRIVYRLYGLTDEEVAVVEGRA